MRTFALFWLPFLAGWSGAVWWMVQGWLLQDSYYSHGVLMPFVAAWGLLRERGTLRGTPRSSSASGWPFLLAGVGLHLAGAALLVDSLSGLSLLPAAAGILLLTEGARRFRVLWPLLGLLALSIPMPLFVSGELAFRMKEAAAAAATVLANLFGLGAVRTGSLLHVPGAGAPLVVGDPCSGLRSLVGLVTLAFCFAFFFGGKDARRRMVLVAAAVPLALGANVARIAALAWVARFRGAEYAATTAHDASNVLIYAFAILVLLGLDVLLSRRGGGP